MARKSSVVERKIPDEFREVFARVIGETGAPAAELAGIVHVESGWNANAVGDGGHSIGLTQLHDAGLGAGLGLKRYDPYVNLSVAAKALTRRYHEIYPGDIDRAIGAHNAGDPQIMQWGEHWRDIPNGLPGGVGEYVETVKAAGETYRSDVAGLVGAEKPPETVLHGLDAIEFQAHAIYGWAGVLDRRDMPSSYVAEQLREISRVLADHVRGLR